LGFAFSCATSGANISAIVITSEFTFQNSHPASVGHKDAFLLYSNTPGKKFKTKLCFCANI
jgi:hypothetical protein